VNSNGQQIPVEPQAVIDALIARVQQLTIENVMLQAVLSQREAANATGNEIRVGSEEPQVSN
jgi:hypothetical protein